jgi:hypothetical protein
MFVAKQAGDAGIELCIYRLHNLHIGTLSFVISPAKPDQAESLICSLYERQ